MPKAAQPRFVSAPRPMTKDDLAAITNSGSFQGPVQTLRASHWKMIKLAAAGLSKPEIAEALGFSLMRVHTILGTPQALAEVQKLKEKVFDPNYERGLDQMTSYMTRVMLTAERMQLDALEEADETGEKVPLRVLDSISQGRADRLGYGKRTTQVNINAEFGAQLEQRIARHRATVIEVEKGLAIEEKVPIVLRRL